MSDAAKIVQRLLSACADENWLALWECYDPNALMVAGSQVLPQHLVPPDHFRQLLTDIAEARRPLGLPRFQWRDGTVQADGEGFVVLATLRELAAQRDVEAGFRVSPQGGVLAMVVNPGPAGRVDIEAAADLAQLPLPSAYHEGFLTALHHSYARRCDGLVPPLRVLPEARFTCQGSGFCCQPGRWAVSLNDNQRQSIARLTEAAATPALRLIGIEASAPAVWGDAQSTADRHRLATDDGLRCHQLLETGHCQIHAAVGWQPVPVCQLFPVKAVPTPDGFDVTIRFSCPTVCANKGELLSDQMSDLRSRIWPYQFRLEDVAEYLPLRRGEAPSVPWATYRDWEGQLLDALESYEGMGTAALETGSRMMAGWLGCDWPVSGSEGNQLFDRLLKPGEPTEWEGGWLGGGWQRAWDIVRAEAVTFRTDGDLLRRYLRTLLFRKGGLAGGIAGVGFDWGVVILAYRMIVADSRFRAVRAQRAVTTEADVIQAVQAVEALCGDGDLVKKLAALPGCPLELPATWGGLLAAGRF